MRRYKTILERYDQKNKVLIIIGVVFLSSFYSTIRYSFYLEKIYNNMLISIVGIVAIVVGIIRLIASKRYKLYINLINIKHITLLDELVDISSKKKKTVIKDIKIMIRKRFIFNVYLDLQNEQVINKQKENIVINKQEHIRSVKCSNCGAISNININAESRCEYCGTSIH